MKKLAELKRRHERLKRSLLGLGPTLQGSILRRVIQRPDPEHPQRTKDYGPYYQWTRKIDGRTAIQNLTASQAKTYERAIRENRKLEKTLAEMRAISLKMLDLTTQGVQKRSPRRDKSEPLT
ncbi:MAG: hypothetical protein HYV26_05010 [Candidatus Hydrogenedentes bacterium]|nr:hypothetical protein [Candidatus Hydrogenedentota bacterium]MBI3119259.1 hypothetical protein [Candidatus Hydrogenedentota bacterium]